MSKFLSSLFLVLAFSTYGFCAAQFSTSFDHDECIAGSDNASDCSLIGDSAFSWNYTGFHVLDGETTKVLDIANRPGSPGAGLQYWVGDGTNINSGTPNYDFPRETKEVWVRWYMLYQRGFSWSGGSPHYDKHLYFRRNDTQTAVIPEPVGEGYALVAQGTEGGYQAHNASFGWQDMMGGNTGDGEWHCYEVHLKMDTNGTVGGVSNADGVGRFWFDGELIIDETNVNWSNGNATVQGGWHYFILDSNQDNATNADGPLQRAVAYMQMDDLAVWTTTPPAVDASGNAWIGPYTQPKVLRTGTHLLRVGDSVLRVQ